MNWLTQLAADVKVRWRSLAGRHRLRERVDEEMRLHLQWRVEQLMEAGASREDAVRAARREFGNPAVIREATLDTWRYTAMETFLQDLRYGARLLGRNPLFALTAAASLAIGIGANTTVFSVANRLLLREPAAVAAPDRLVDIAPTMEGGRFVEPVLPYGLYLEIRQRSTTLESVYGYQLDPQAMSLAGDAGAERVFITSVTPNYFSALGIRAAIGRVFDEPDVQQSDPVVVLDHGFWRRRFNGDPSIVGAQVRLNGQPATIVGVAPEGFQGLSVVIADMWLPIPAGGTPFVRMAVGGRLRPGTSVRQAGAEMEAISRAIARDLPMGQLVPGIRRAGSRGLGVTRASAVPPVLRTPIAAFLALLTGIVSLVLVIACANIAGVLLARATARRREIAVRLAIGAGRARLVRQLLTETLLLFLVGGAAGVALARVATSLLVTALPTMPVPIDVALPIDLRVLLFTAAVSFVSALLSGLVPALQASKADVVSALKNDSQGPSDRLRLRSAFVVAQVAFSILLVVCAGLLVRALQRTGSVDVGFEARGVEVAYLDLGLAGYNDATGRIFIRDLGERLRGLAGVEDATVAVGLPSEAARRVVGSLRETNGSAPPPALPEPIQDQHSSNIVGPEYFSTLRIPLVAGRDFTEADRQGAQRVAIVSEAMARDQWPGQNAIGQHLAWTDFGARGAAVDLLVVGVAADLKTGGRGKDRPLVYLPLQQTYRPGFAILARTTHGQRLAGEIRALVASMDPNLPIVSARTLDDESSPGVTQLRVSASVSGVVGLVGLLLAAIGIYGVTAYSVTRRTREIGVRVAMGAQQGDVLRMVLRQGMTLVAIGSGIGLLLAAAAASRLLVRLLFGLPALDPLTFGGAAVLFAAIGLTACYVPARRATQIDATEALRCE